VKNSLIAQFNSLPKAARPLALSRLDRGFSRPCEIGPDITLIAVIERSRSTWAMREHGLRAEELAAWDATMTAVASRG
jgi:hypothetical protein